MNAIQRAAWNIDLLLREMEGDQVAGRILRVTDNRVALRHLLAELQQLAESGAPEHSINALDTMQLIVSASPRGRIDGLSHLRNWLKGARHVILCDPYLLQRQSRTTFPTDEAYIDALIRMIPASAREVDVVCNSYTRTLKDNFLRRAKEGRSVRVTNTREIHDRFVVRDGEVKVLGTSIGGFGAKLSVIVDIGPTDARAVIGELSRLGARI